MSTIAEHTKIADVVQRHRVPRPRNVSVPATVIAVLLVPSAAAQPPPVEAFAALPAMQSPAISADGERLAFITHAPTGSYVVVSTIEGMAITTIVNPGEAKPRSVHWVADDALVFTAGVATNLVGIGVPGLFEATSPYGVDLSGEAKVTRLLEDRARTTRQGGGGATTIGGLFAIDGAQLIGYDRAQGRILYPKFDTNTADRVLWAVDPKTDERRLVDRAGRAAIDWVVNESGEPVFRVDYTQNTNHFTLLKRPLGHWEVLIEESIEIPELSLFGLGGDGNLIVGTRPKDTDRFGLYSMSIETGEIGAPVLAHDRYDVASVIIDPYTNRVIGAGTPEGPPVWFDAELAEQQLLVTDAFPGEAAAIVSWSQDRNRMIVMSDGERRAPAVYLYDRAAPSLDQISNTYTSLQGASLPARREYRYTARDGTEIPGYLTRPLDSDGPTPLVVLPHGGPAARDVGGFDWLAHFLASRGYTVLQPNFRGSGGFGNAWETAGHGQWGIGVMQHDLTDGVAALVAAELADPERVCIVGASYGGYAALAGAVFTPELYRCAASIAGVADLVAMLGYESDRGGDRSATVAYWRRAMSGGDPANLNDRLATASPAAHAEQADAPILLVHGLDDSVVPIEQSRIMQRALESAGKRVELVELAGEDHWLSTPAARLSALKALEGFLEEHLAR